MEIIPASRAAYLIQFIGVLRELGTPVERELARAKLPMLIEELPDAYVSNRLAHNFVERCARQEGIDDLGFLAARRLCLPDLGLDRVLEAQGAITLYQRLNDFMSLAVMEDNLLRTDLISGHSGTKVVCNLEFPWRVANLEYSEWLQVMLLIEIVRSAGLPGWRPTEITFRSNFQPCDEALDHFGNTRLLFDQPETSIAMPTELLATPCSPARWPMGELKSEQPSRPKGFIKTLRNVVRPYLRSGEKYPSIGFAAGLVGTSVRSLQRKLARRDLSYSQLIQQARFESAIEILKDPNIKIIDVAMATGYDDPAHFARAFRKTSGLSPRKYRQTMALAAS